MLYIHPDECVDCGACEPVCPVEAIYYEDDVPEQWGQYTQINADFFVELGSPGGAAKVGLTENDPQVVKDLTATGRRRLSGPVQQEPRMGRPSVSASLPEFPWDTLADAKALAAAHRDGIVDLSVGTPVDPVAPLIQEALAAASSAPGYPATAGTATLRESAVAALSRRYGITGLTEAAVLPVIGTKELIAWLPTLLGLGPADAVVVPELAYPTYDVGRPAGRGAGAARGLADPAGSAIPVAGLPELPEQPDRACPGRRPPAQGGRLGARQKCAAGFRRVLPGVGLGGRAAVGTASLGL